MQTGTRPRRCGCARTGGAAVCCASEHSGAFFLKRSMIYDYEMDHKRNIQGKTAVDALPAPDGAGRSWHDRFHHACLRLDPARLFSRHDARVLSSAASDRAQLVSRHRVYSRSLLPARESVFLRGDLRRRDGGHVLCESPEDRGARGSLCSVRHSSVPGGDERRRRVSA